MEWYNQDTLKKLRTQLARGVSKLEEIETIAFDSNIPLEKLELKGSVLQRWGILLKYANKQDTNVIHELVKNANDLYPGNRYLLEATAVLENSYIFDDSLWREKLDRLEQIPRIIMPTQDMLSINHHPRALIFVWYGEENQGVDKLIPRITLELESRKISPWEVPMEWLGTLENFDNSLRELYGKNLINSSFLPKYFPNIGDKLREKIPYNSGKNHLIFISHPPFLENYNLMCPNTLKRYFNWLENVFFWEKNRIPKDIYFIFGLPFITSDIENFKINYSEIIDGLESKNMTADLLPALEKVNQSDVKKFITAHIKPISRDKIDKISKEIIIKTKGNYDKTIEELRALADGPFDI